jgi:flagellin-like protein
MKGVSSVIAIILILMIVIALAALAYTWFSGIFASLTSTAGTAVTTTTSAMATQFRIESSRYSSVIGGIAIAIRNTGTQSFNASSAIVGLYFDNVLWSGGVATAGGAGCTVSAANGFMLDKGCVATYGIAIASSGVACPICPGVCNNMTKVTVGTGLMDTSSLVC